MRILPDIFLFRKRTHLCSKVSFRKEFKMWFKGLICPDDELQIVFDKKLIYGAKENASLQDALKSIKRAQWGYILRKLHVV